MAKAADIPTDQIPEGAAEAGVQKITWDDANMNTTFANVVNGASTREEVTLLFGTNQTWNVKEDGEVRINLSDRIILTPFAAKRLLLLLVSLIKQYEDRYGTLQIGAAGGEDRS